MVIQATKQTGTWILVDAAGDKRFFCHDGSVVKNLTELVDCLTHMTEEVFRYHVTSEKNDFSNWVRNVLGDEILASKLNDINNPLEASKIVANKITWIQRNRNQRHRLHLKR